MACDYIRVGAIAAYSILNKWAVYWEIWVSSAVRLVCWRGKQSAAALTEKLR